MTRAERKYGSIVKSMPDEVTKAIEATFDLTAEKLPSRSIIAPYVKDPFENTFGIKPINDILSSENRWLTPFVVREMYLEHSFVAYTDEMLHAMKRFCDKKKFKKVHELCCGTGWFSHWMKKYGIPLDKAIDNKTWSTYKNENKFLPIVTQNDAARFVKTAGDADMFVLSWPYMDPLARMIWDAMKPGQYLLYIGEDYGGCTADPSFFDAVQGCRIDNDKDFNKIVKSFVQFNGLHDRPELYQKRLQKL